MPNDSLKTDGAAEAPSSPAGDFSRPLGSQYIPFVEIPEEIHAAAQTLHIYFEKQGMREWEFSAVADRRLVTKLERERDAYRQELQNIADAKPSRWGDMVDQFRAWAQNRARHALNSANDQGQESPPVSGTTQTRKDQ